MTTNLLSRTPLLPSFFPAHARNLQRNCALTWIRTADLSNFERLKFPTFPFLSFFFLVLFCFPTKFQGSFPCNLPPCPSFSSFKVRMALGRENLCVNQEVQGRRRIMTMHILRTCVLAPYSYLYSVNTLRNFHGLKVANGRIRITGTYIKKCLRKGCSKISRSC